MKAFRIVLTSLLVVAVFAGCRQTPLSPQDADTTNATVVDAGEDQRVDISEEVSLAGQLRGGPAILGSLEYAWTKVDGPGDVEFGAPDALETSASFGVPGSYTLRLEATGNGFSASDEVVVIVSSGSNASTSEVFEVRVAASLDDAEERDSRGMRLTSSDLELTDDGGFQTVGMRFQGVAVPAGASIVSAYVQFTADEGQSVATSLVVEGQASADALAFSSTSGDISSRPRTGASVVWEPGEWAIGDAGAAQRTPDLGGVIQEIVDQSGWSSGNALVLIVTGTGLRTAESFDGRSSSAPLLHIEFSGGDGGGGGGESGNVAPVVDAGVDQSVALADGAVLDGTVSDDGLPDGTLVSAWSQVDGPGTATFGDAAAVDTTVSFSDAGVYTLQLEASDGELSSSDQVVVTVESGGESGNVAPVVDAGVDQSVALADGAVLDGTVSDDGLPSGGTLVSAWSQVDGPGTATFGDAAAVDTTVSFDVAGVYTLQLEATDGELSSSDQVVITAQDGTVTGDPNPVTGLSQVNHVKTGYDGGSLLEIPSIDPSGVGFYPGSSHLLIVDGEINEEEDVFATVAANTFEVAPNGSELFDRWDLTTSSNGSNNEPTGIAHCAFDDHVYVSNDRSRAVYRYALENSVLTLDDKLSISDYTGDPEGITCDPATGLIYVIGGADVNVIVLEYDGGLRVVGSYDLFDMNSSTPEGVPSDGEGIVFDPGGQHLFVVSPADDALYQYTPDGVFVDKYVLTGASPAPINLAGVGIGPSSGSSSSESFYIVDRRKDNNATDDPRDGALYEFQINRER